MKYEADESFIYGNDNFDELFEEFADIHEDLYEEFKQQEFNDWCDANDITGGYNLYDDWHSDHNDSLKDEFADKYKEMWDGFVEEQFQKYLQGDI